MVHRTLNLKKKMKKISRKPNKILKTDGRRRGRMNKNRFKRKGQRKIQHVGRKNPSSMLRLTERVVKGKVLREGRRLIQVSRVPQRQRQLEEHLRLSLPTLKLAGNQLKER